MARTAIQLIVAEHLGGDLQGEILQREKFAAESRFTDLAGYRE